MYQGRRRESNRLKNFDYAESGWYFVTICTQDREKMFGELQNQKMILNAPGKIVARCWYNLPRHYLNCRLDEFIIMPNHLHGIIAITGDRCVDQPVGTGLKPVPTMTSTASLSEIIRGLKTFSAKQINLIRQTSGLPVWQRSFYDHIIRNEKEYLTIKKYIYENPLHWLDDRNYMK